MGGGGNNPDFWGSVGVSAIRSAAAAILYLAILATAGCLVGVIVAYLL